MYECFATTQPLVVTIPSYAIEKEEFQTALLRACKIVDVQASLIDESTATTYEYANDNLSQIKKANSQTIVVFVDMGHSKTTVTVSEFTSELKARVIVHRSDRNLGGRDLDWQILQKLCKDF